MRRTQCIPVEFLSNPTKIGFLLLVAFLLGLTACASESPPRPRTFLFVHTATGALFRAQTSVPEVIAQAEAELNRPFHDRHLFPNGLIARGDGGYNAPWSWHFVPDRWELVEVSIEVCDATPAYVEANVDYFVDTLGRYCPWGARLVRTPDEARQLVTARLALLGMCMWCLQ